jgi:hypothetical protein
MECPTRTRIAASALVLATAMNSQLPANAKMPLFARSPLIVLAQATVPPTGMMDSQHPMPMNERYLKRFPQPARVGDLVGLPLLDLKSSTLGYVREIVRTSAGKIEFVVGYSWFWGWFGRPVAVPLEALGIEGRQLVSLDMPRTEYAAAPTWHDTAAHRCQPTQLYASRCPAVDRSLGEAEICGHSAMSLNGRFR